MTTVNISLMLPLVLPGATSNPLFKADGAGGGTFNRPFISGVTFREPPEICFDNTTFNKIFWPATDGNAYGGLYILTTGTCYHITNDSNNPSSNWVVDVFNPSSTHTITLMPGQETWLFYDTTNTNLDFQSTACCVHPSTQVQIPNKNNGCDTCLIKDLNKGDVVIGMDGKDVVVKYNIKYISTKDYVRIAKGSLGKDLPTEDLLIRRGHPILYNGKETNCTDLLNGNSITDVVLSQPEHVWSLCTENRTFVLMNGVPVCTWSQVGWENFVNNDITGKGIIYWTQ